MKRTQLAGSLILGVALAVISCQRGPKSGQEAVQTGPIDYSAFQDQIVEIIRKSPKAVDMIHFLDKVGTSFIQDLTLPVSEVERFETQAEMSLALGVYGIDMTYAYTFGRYDIVARNAAIVDMLTAKAGIDHDRPGKDIIAQFEGDKDSLGVLLRQDWQHVLAMMTDGEHTESIAMIFIGANIEAMYIISQLTLYARDNQTMIDFLSQKGDYARGLLNLLEILATDKMFLPHVEQMRPIVAFFDDHEQISFEELAELAALIESVRAQIVS